MFSIKDSFGRDVMINLDLVTSIVAWNEENTQFNFDRDHSIVVKLPLPRVHGLLIASGHLEE